MLDVALSGISLRVLEDVSMLVPRSTHTAIVGPRGAGTSTLLRIIAGLERKHGGRVRIGTQDVTGMKSAQRPLLYVTADLDVPGRWSVEHALVAAVRSRSIDRIDRRRELMFAAEKWSLDLSRRVDTLSDSERARVLLARIELKRPAILLADRLLRDIPAAMDEWYRTLRVLGTTVISAPASVEELGQTDAVAVLEKGRIVQRAPVAEVHASPASVEAAQATGEISIIPIVVRGFEVSSPAGAWTLREAPFQGEGIALVRPDHFSIAGRDQESDLVFGIEEASFERGRWMARGFLTGGVVIRVSLPAGEKVFKGRLLALRLDSERITLLQSA